MGGRGLIKFTVREANQGRIFKAGGPKIIVIYQCTNGKEPQLVI